MFNRWVYAYYKDEILSVFSIAPSVKFLRNIFCYLSYFSVHFNFPLNWCWTSLSYYQKYIYIYIARRKSIQLFLILQREKNMTSEWRCVRDVQLKYNPVRCSWVHFWNANYATQVHLKRCLLSVHSQKWFVKSRILMLSCSK